MAEFEFELLGFVSNCSLGSQLLSRFLIIKLFNNDAVFPDWAEGRYGNA